MFYFQKTKKATRIKKPERTSHLAIETMATNRGKKTNKA